MGRKWLKCMGQLDVALSVEHPELQAPPIPLVYKLTYLWMKSYSVIKEGAFGNEVRRYMQLALNQKGPKLRHKVLSTSGYTIDLEILLDKLNQPLIPACTTLEALQNSPDARLQGVFSDFTKSELLQSLAALPRYSTKQQHCSRLASDWGWDWSKLVHRKIAVEIERPEHFSVNNNHRLGWSVLRKRQLRALGWEVVEVCVYVCVFACVCSLMTFCNPAFFKDNKNLSIFFVQVPYTDWNNMSPKQAVKYLHRKIFDSHSTLFQR